VNPEALRRLLEEVRAGGLSVEDGLERLKRLPFEDLGFATLDHHRQLRLGQPEVLFGQGKTTSQIEEIAGHLAAASGSFLATRLTEDASRALVARFPAARWNAAARTVWLPSADAPASVGLVAVVSAGTADQPVAEEAAVTAEATGSIVERHYDLGVAGIHRLLSRAPALDRARALVVVAGMEGALASVVGGVVGRPLIAVPTSVGYGASFGGLAALLAMLNSCAPGVLVVNIDNGFGAGYAASLINRTISSAGTPPVVVR
jgi:NCAIR mutase (PurE)-related protein